MERTYNKYTDFPRNTLRAEGTNGGLKSLRKYSSETNPFVAKRLAISCVKRNRGDFAELDRLMRSNRNRSL